MKTTLEAMIVPVGEKPYPKTLEADDVMQMGTHGIGTVCWAVE